MNADNVLVKVTDLKKHYNDGTVHALDGVSMDISRGEVVVMETLNEKFDKIKNGKGIAYTVSMQSIIGVAIYQFLSNNQTSKKEEKPNE